MTFTALNKVPAKACLDLDNRSVKTNQWLVEGIQPVDSILSIANQHLNVRETSLVYSTLAFLNLVLWASLFTYKIIMAIICWMQWN